jgi:hypothetical protein
MIASLTLGGTLLNGERHPHAMPRLCLNRGDSGARLGLRLFGVPDLVRRWLRRLPDAYPELPSATS